MPGKRQPTDVLLLNGKKHLSKAEEYERRASEVKVPPAQKATPPKWLPEVMRKEYRKIGKQLITLGLYSDLDADTLGRYLVAHHQYLAATGYTNAALREGNVTDADAWGRIQDRYFKQARNCANDLGMTVSARCRLVIPSPLGADEPEDEFTQRLLSRQSAAAAGVL